MGDGSTGSPISGADVYVDGQVYTTDSEGVATFDNQADRLTFTVMSPDYDTVSVVGISERSLYLLSSRSAMTVSCRIYRRA